MIVLGCWLWVSGLASLTAEPALAADTVRLAVQKTGTLAWEIEPPPIGYLTVLPALILSGLMLGALGMLLSSIIKQLENFAGVMNFVIFPMFFASSALYPLWRVKEASPVLYHICQLNPFTHAVELIRFALYGKLNEVALAVVFGCTVLFMVAAIVAYDPSRGFVARRGGPGEAA